MGEVNTKLLAIASGIKDIDDPIFKQIQDPPASPSSPKSKRKRLSSLKSWGWAEVDSTKNQELREPVIEPDNKYA